MFLIEDLLEKVYGIEIEDPTAPIPVENRLVLYTVPNNLKPLGTLLLQLEAETEGMMEKDSISRKQAELLIIRTWLVAELGKIYGIYPSLDFGISVGWVVWMPVPVPNFN